MTKLIELETPGHHTGLLPCCRHLARHTGQEAFLSHLESLQDIPGPKGPQETVESIIRAGRIEGLQAIILQPQPEQFATLTGQLPAVVELRNGRYVILAGIGEGEQSEGVTILNPQPDGQMQPEQLTRPAFQAIRAGGLLRFEKINTALVCFTLIAREHKIELTRDRLLHEYNLGTAEIPQKHPAANGQGNGLEGQAHKPFLERSRQPAKGLSGHRRPP